MLLTMNELECCLEELSLFQGLYVELQVHQLHQAVRVLFSRLKSRCYLICLREQHEFERFLLAPLRPAAVVDYRRKVEQSVGELEL